MSLLFVRRKDDVLSSSMSSLEKEKLLNSKRPRRVLIVGTGYVGRSLAQQMEADPRYEMVGFVDDEVASGEDIQWPLLGPNRATSQLVREYAIDDVLVAYAPTWQQELVDEITLSGQSVRVRIVPSTYEIMMPAPHIESIGDVALLPLLVGQKQASDFVKRFFDLLTSIFGIIILSPLILLTALLVAFTSPGPVLYSQERVGKSNKIFTLLKFRTMRVDAENGTGPVLSAGSVDARLTPIGRWLRLFRLDEIPQLLNVLRGEMSLVGPRPERPHFVNQFIARNPIYAYRHEVRPGITGLAQVHGGYYTDARDKLRFDLFYVSHHSLLLDISILFQTFRNIIISPDGF
jgi:exopolysaccharide biosynthesis polyprenyl glycosylphosphotransferase